MNQKTIILTVILFALIVIGMFVYATLKNSEVSERVSEGVTNVLFV